jgi:hypothetical protein
VEIVLAMAVFGLAMAGMGVGVIVSNRELKGSCGGAAELEDHGVACGACVKKEAEVCPSDDPLVALAQISHPNPKHRR